MKKILIIGGGPAGMMAAITAAKQGARVTLIEKNEKLGKKLYITGKGRCNLTNNTDIQGLLSQTITNPRFLQSAYHALPPQDLMAMFEKWRTPLKTERGNRVFPASDRAQDITNALAREMDKLRVKVLLKTEVTDITQGKGFVVHTPGNTYSADALIIATGGLSYPSTGSTGAGYQFAQSFDHTVTDTHPSIVAINVAESWVNDLVGLSLRNVKCTVKGKKPIFAETGEMLFTPTGITGPIILRASAYLTGKFDQNYTMAIDLKPALTHEQLDARILRDFAENKNKNFVNALDDLLPQRLIHTIIALSQIPPDTKVNTITKAQRQQLIALLKALPLTPTKTAGYGEAVITRGGVNVKEINPSTMESKLVPGLYFAGEVLDVDAMTGGYNLQIAFSTGFVAGESAAQPERSI